MAVAAAAGAATAATATTTATTLAAVTAAVSIASTAYSLYAADQNADAQMAAAERQNEQKVQSAIANYDELSEVEQEAYQQSLEDSMTMQRQYLREKGRINVMAAYAGTGGMSVARQLNDLERTKYSNFNVIQQDQQAAFDNIADQAESIKFGAAASMNVAPVSRPSWFASAVDIGTAALNGYSGYDKAVTAANQAQPANTLRSSG